MTFGAGAAAQATYSGVKAQTFQGWAVWRSSRPDPDNMTLVGLYDRVNPEDCIVGYCGDESYCAALLRGEAGRLLRLQHPGLGPLLRRDLQRFRGMRSPALTTATPRWPRRRTTRLR